MSQLAEQLLLACKGLEPHRMADMLSELRSDPQMAQRPDLDADIREILKLLGGQDKTDNDIDDEEKFLYGESEVPKISVASEPLQHHELDLYGDLTEEALYGDLPIQNATILEQNVTVQTSNPIYPPGTEPLEESERQALEEYEKMQDLLKTIGLDLGVAEISKMAARTKERLEGNKPPPKTPTRRRHNSSGSSDGGRSCRRRSQSSSSSSRSRSHRRGDSWSSDDGGGKSSAPPKSHKDIDAKETTAEPLLQNAPQPGPCPPHTGMPIPTYPPPQVHGLMPPNFPPPPFGQYGNYVPFMHHQWPPMYPPPNISLPPHTEPRNYTQPLSYEEPLTKGVAEPAATGQCLQGTLTF